jgi:hypothetical protein
MLLDQSDNAMSRSLTGFASSLALFFKEKPFWLISFVLA